ncbi:MAG: type II toxin-antitoxin system HicB family antitoxin [Dehalococcoidia bacterium]
MRYKVVVNRDDEGNWVVSVPALPGCHTWGDSRDTALANAREAIEGYIESLEAAGEPVPSDETDVEVAVVSVP